MCEGLEESFTKADREIDIAHEEMHNIRVMVVNATVRFHFMPLCGCNRGLTTPNTDEYVRNWAACVAGEPVWRTVW